MLPLFFVMLAAPAQLIENAADGTAMLTSAGAAHLAELPLRCLHQEYPNKTGHTIESGRDAVLSPKQLHPSFYGCFDWHSSVHGHWMLVRLLKSYPALPQREEIRRALETSFAADRLKAEAAYFSQYKLARTYERTYGWAWLLKLDHELMTFDDAQARKWHANLQPLTEAVVQLWTAFLPKQTYPNRTGVHPNTAFGLVFALDWARAKGDKTVEALIVQRAKDYYMGNTAAPAILEPDGTDFLSPSLEVCDLMRRVLPPGEFAPWLSRYMTADGLANVITPPIVSDRTDYAIVHLDGLFLSRAWCLRGIAKALPAGDGRRPRLARAARDLINTALPHVATGEYGGEHWLASFAVYALSE